MTKRFFKHGIWVAFYLMLFFSTPAQPDIFVIVNADCNINQLTRDEVVNIFMGRYRKLPDGTSVMPLDIKGDSPLRKSFYRALLDKSLAEINAYWTRLIFSGRTSPPLMLDNASQVVEKVAHDPTVIGFVSNSSLERSVKAVYRLPELSDQ